MQELLPVELREFVSGKCGSKGISTGTVTLPSNSRFPYHQHPFSEAMTVLEGEIDVTVQGRCYRLERLDCIHIPAQIAHGVRNRHRSGRAIAHYALASETPVSEIVEQPLAEDKRFAMSEPGAPEFLSRFGNIEAYDLGDGTKFYDLFASRFGSVGICGGYGEFAPGTSLPCHVHQFDESISIVMGQAICRVAGRRYHLSGCDTAFIPEGLPHRFLNESSAAMGMIWVYAGNEPERTLVAAGYCDGSIQWPAQQG